MTQQQKQKERPQQATRTAGELVIAVLDLLLGLPLGLLMFVALSPQNTPRDLTTWLYAVPWLLVAVGLMSAGLMVLRRHYWLARTLQWLALVGGVLIGATLVYMVFQKYPSDQSLLLGLGGFLLAIATLIALPIWLKKLTED
jgi:phosphatidylserine synthase